MWRCLRVVVPRSTASRVAGRLHASGSAGIQEQWLPGEAPPPRQPWDDGPEPPLPDHVELVAWYEDPDEPRIEQVANVEGRWEDAPDEDWENAWKRGFERVVAGRFAVAPPWCAEPGDVVIEPGQGFGTGQHPTTRGALAQLDAVVDGAHTVLDVGCGSGVLAIAAAKVGKRAVGIDVDEAAVRDARANAAANAVDVRFDTTPLAGVRDRYDVVLANLYAEVLVALAPDLVRVSRRLILAGILADREDAVCRAFAALTLEDRVQDGEWIALRYRGMP